MSSSCVHLLENLTESLVALAKVFFAISSLRDISMTHINDAYQTSREHLLFALNDLTGVLIAVAIGEDQIVWVNL